MDADSFVVAVDPVPVRLGFRPIRGLRIRGQDRGDDLVAQGEQGGDGARGDGWDVVAAGATGSVDELFAAEFAQIVGRLPDGVLVVGGAGYRVDLRGELADGEPAWRRGQREHGRQRVPHPLLVQVDTADPGSAQGGPGGQLVKDTVGDESGVHAVQRGGEPFGDTGQLGHDLGELLDHPPAAQLRGVVHDRLEPQHAFAFCVRLTGQPPEVAA